MPSNSFSLVLTDLLSRGDAARIAKESGLPTASISRFKAGERIPSPENMQRILDAIRDPDGKQALLLSYIRTVAPPKEAGRIRVDDATRGRFHEDEVPPMADKTRIDLDFIEWHARHNPHVSTLVGAMANSIRSLARMERSALEAGEAGGA